jgi:hypothetical protein
MPTKVKWLSRVPLKRALALLRALNDVEARLRLDDPRHLADVQRKCSLRKLRLHFTKVKFAWKTLLHYKSYSAA